MRTLLAALFLLAPLTASAALSWTIAHESGSAVMGEPSTIMFRVSNVQASTSRLTKVVLTMPASYTIESGVAPSGWTVSAIEAYDILFARYYRIVFSATGSCPNKGLAPGTSALFGFRAVSGAAASDRTDQFILSFLGDRSFAEDGCSNPVVSAQPQSNAGWTRAGLSAQLSIEPRTLATNDELTVTMTVTNKSTALANNVTPTAPISAPSPSQFAPLSPAPAALNLVSGATGTFVWLFRADSDGAFTLTASASNGTVSSPEAVSPQGFVGLITAQTAVHPSSVVSGQVVKVSLTLSNNGPVPIQSVIPEPLTRDGTASAVLESGPTPTEVGVLPPGSTTSFLWTYRVSGSPGDTYGFEGAAQIAIDGDSEILASSPATGSIVVHTLTVAPASIPDGTTNKTVTYAVTNGGGASIKEFSLSAPSSTYFAPADTPFASVPSGWTAQKTSFPTLYRWTASNEAAYIQPGASLGFGFIYKKVGTGSMSNSMTFTHSATLVLDDGFSAGVQTAITVLVAKTAADVGSPVVIAGSRTNTLIWNNPSDHDGVLVLRATGGAVSAIPEAGRLYQAGETIGNAVVAYANSGFASSYVDQQLTNGTRYYYKVFSHDAYLNYGTGSVPSSQGLFSEPTAGASGTPLWCYSTGLPMLVQPTRDSTGAVMAANQSGALTSNLADGGERMRPVKLSGVVQSRFPIIGSLQGRSGRWAIVGDQSGHGYLVNSTTGAIAWTALGTASDEHLQASGSIQLNGSNATFTARYPGKDLVFFATRNSALPSRTATNNRVVAVSSVDGSQVWSYQPGNLDIVSGYLALVSGANQLFVASYSNNNTQPSLRVLDTVNGGALLASFSLGDLATGVSLDWVGQQYTQALAANTSGTAYGIDLATLTKVWEVNLGGAPTGYLFPVGSGFIALLDSGIKRYVTSGSTITLAWSASVPGASGMAVDAARDTVLVGSSDGTIYEFADGATGGAIVAPLRQLSVSPGKRLSGPTLDTTRGRLYVGTEDGRLCAFSYP